MSILKRGPLMGICLALLCGSIAAQIPAPDRSAQFESAAKGDTVALSALDKQADGGDATAAYYLAVIHHDSGRLKASARWLKKAAGQGLIDAKYALADMQISGLIESKEITDIESWLCQANQAVRMPDFEHHILTGNLPLSVAAFRKGVYERLLKVLNVNFHRLIFRLKMPDAGTELKELEKRSNDGDTTAQYKLGLILEIRMGSTDHRALAVNLFSQAANAGNPDAQIKLGSLLLGGQYVARDDKLAAGLFRRAAEHDVPRGQALLGLLYFDGRGVPKDPAQGYDWLLKAAASYDRYAMGWLGLVAAEGRSGPVDKVAALQWVLLAAEEDRFRAPLLLYHFAGEATLFDLESGRRAAYAWKQAHTPPPPRPDLSGIPIASPQTSCEIERHKKGITGLVQLIPCTCKDQLKDWR